MDRRYRPMQPPGGYRGRQTDGGHSGRLIASGLVVAGVAALSALLPAVGVVSGGGGGQPTFRELSARIDDRERSDVAAPILETLLDWGATDVNVFDSPRGVSIDFHTPMPGDQPIRSGVLVDEDGVTNATLRYGVADRAGPIGLMDLVAAVKKADPPPGAQYTVNFGDLEQYPPRPHVLVGWLPSEMVGNSTFDSTQDTEHWRPHEVDMAYRGDPDVIVAHADEFGAVGPRAFADFMVRAGERIRDSIAF